MSELQLNQLSDAFRCIKLLWACECGTVLPDGCHLILLNRVMKDC